MSSVVLLGVAQDGGVPQAGCSCHRCMSVHKQQSKELFPVSLGIEDDDGNFHLIEASRTMAKQLFLWSTSKELSSDGVVSPIQSVTLTHLHLGHIDGLGQFGREVMGQNQVRLHASRKVLSALKLRGPVLEPFEPIVINDSKESSNKIQSLGKGVSLEFYPVPHRDNEEGDTHAIVVRGSQKNILFLPDHDTWEQTLTCYGMTSIRSWLLSLNVQVALIDGTFWSYHEIRDHSSRDFQSIPHPPITQTLELLGTKQSGDPDIIFIHLNHTNPVIDNHTLRSKVESMGWKVGEQGMFWTIS